MPERIAVCIVLPREAGRWDPVPAGLRHQLDEELELTFACLLTGASDQVPATIQAWSATDDRMILGSVPEDPPGDPIARRCWTEALWNRSLDLLNGRPYDRVLFVEAGLTLPVDLILELMRDDADIVAPCIYLGSLFYDTWSFRGSDGARYEHAPPHHPCHRPHGLIEMSSVGGVFLVRRAVLDAGIRFEADAPEGPTVGFCDAARAAGFRIRLNSRLSVVKPTVAWREEMYAIGAVSLEGFESDPFLRQVLSSLSARLEGSTDLLLETPELPEDHPVFDGLHELISDYAAGASFSLRSEKLSERPRRYRLIIKNTQSEPSRCKSGSTR